MSDTEQPIALPSISVMTLRMLDGTRALTDEELVEALLRLANTGSAAAGALLQTGVALGAAVLARHEAISQREGRQMGPPELREALAEIVAAGKRKVPAASTDIWRRRAAGLVLLRVFGRGGEPARYRYLAFEQWPSGPQPVIANALLLLLERPFRGKLCQCQFAECGRFFLAARPPKPDRKGKKRGANIRAYCPGTDHKERASPAKASERMAKLRAERAKERAERAKLRAVRHK